MDCTKLRANTSRSKALSHRWMVEAEARLEAENGAKFEPRHHLADMMRVGNDAARTYAYNTQTATSEDGLM